MELYAPGHGMDHAAGLAVELCLLSDRPGARVLITRLFRYIHNAVQRVIQDLARTVTTAYGKIQNNRNAE